MNEREAFNLLQKYSLRLEQIEYSTIIDLLENSIKRIPLPLAEVQLNNRIERARLNEVVNGKIKLFKTIDELSYIKDEKVIKEKLTKFGRANKPHEVMFYSSIETFQIDKARATAIAETSKHMFDDNSVILDGEFFTITRFRNHSKFLIVEVVYSEEAIRNNQNVRISYNKQKENARKHKDIDLPFYEDFLIFISNEFSRQTDNHNDYKISTAYTEIALRHPQVKGVTYPSVQTSYAGSNLVLPPKTVDNYLYPEVITTSILYKNKKVMFLNNGGYNSKNFENEIHWEKLDKKHIATKEQILGQLFKK